VRGGVVCTSSKVTNARRLEDLDPGTPVIIGDGHIGEVRSVYAEGDSKLAEFLVVAWASRGVDVIVATTDVQTIDARGVVLMGSQEQSYAHNPAFKPEGHPTLRKLR